MNRCRVNRIRQIVQLRQIMKRWHALAVSRKVSSTVNGCTLSCGFDLSYDSDEEYCCRSPSSAPPDVPKGYLAVYVGREKEDTRRFVIPTNYLSRPAFRRLLDKAEEEFGFDHQGVLTIPCETLVFENILQNEQDKQAINIISCHEPDVHIPSTPLPEISFA